MGRMTSKESHKAGTGAVPTIARKPQVGDVVLSDQGHTYLIESVVRRGGVDRRVAFYEVRSTTSGLMNVLEPAQVKTVAASSAGAIRANMQDAR